MNLEYEDTADHGLEDRTAGGIPSDTPEHTDNDVLYNLAFSAGVGATLFLIFCFLRIKFRRVYSSNFVGVQRPRFKARAKGFWGWLVTTFVTTDAELLSFAGMDSYLFVQVLRLILGLLIAVSIPMLTVLLPLYYFTGSEAAIETVYMQLSILNCRTRYLWFPFLLCYFTSALVFYCVYIFYRNYSLVRQAYLKDPSALTSCLVLQRLIGVTGSLEEARRVASLHNRSVVLSGIADHYDRERLHELLGEVSIGRTTSIAFVNPRDELVIVVEKRNAALTKLEAAIQSFLKSAFDSLKGNRHRRELIDELYAMPRPAASERLRMVRQLRDPAYYPDFRPKAKSRQGQEVDAISYFYERLLTYEQRLEESLEEYIHGYSEGGGLDADTDRQSGPSAGDIAAGATVVRRRPRSRTDPSTLISAAKFFWFGHNLKELKLTLYGSSQAAVVIMETPRGASAVSQTVLSRRPFSLTAEKAPAADDVLWDNLQLSSSDRNLRQTAGEILFILTNIFFIPFVSALSTLTQLDKLMRWLPWLDRFLGDRPKLRSTLQGILAPLALNIALGVAPYILRFIAYYQGKVSKTAVEYSVLRKYSWFLFFQSFVVIIIAASLVDVINGLFEGKWDKILTSLRETFPSKSALFFNIAIQRAFISMPQLLLKPAPLFFGLLGHFSSFSASPRTIYERTLPEMFEQGQDYPQYVIYILQITLAFMTITPLSLLAGLVYFSIALGMYRHSTLYNLQVRHESGGIYWRRISQHIVVGCLLNQIFTFLHFTMRGAAFQAIFLAPLIFSTFAFNRFLNRTFASRTLYLPQTHEEEATVDRLLEELIEHQNAMLECPKAKGAGAVQEERADMEEVEEADFIPVRDLLPKQQHAESQRTEAEILGATGGLLYSLHPSDLANPYNNPVLFRRLSSVLVHPLLIPVMRKLRQDAPSTTTTQHLSVNQ